MEAKYLLKITVTEEEPLSHLVYQLIRYAALDLQDI
jgi:hypothetical protein